MFVNLLDTGQFTFGNAATIIVVAFGAGGTWFSIKAGLKDVQVKQVEDAKHVASELTTVHTEIADLRNEFVRKDVDREREQRVTDTLNAMKDRIDKLELAFRGSRR